MGHILVIDQGTTSTRAIVFDERARPLAGTPTCKETTALGAAFLAGSRADRYPTPGEFAEYWGLDRRLAPMMSSQARERRRAGWRAAVDATLYRREPLQ
jgi:glycerol kinase